ncbi:MAG: crossover junction endodeoxyribonuclease RuvC [Candidatus Gracilibacteria bacterium]|jgi:crossover junction endodeoxyribonuclease RuvC
MRIIGLDPGFATTGFAILDVNKTCKKLISYGTIKTSKTADFPARLKEIFDDLNVILLKYKPETCSIEQLFFSKNITTGINVSHARGVILMALYNNKVPIHEITPSAMKKNLTGDGKADKRAIQKMVMMELRLKTIPKPDDAADAVSLALCLASTLR